LNLLAETSEIDEMQKQKSTLNKCILAGDHQTFFAIILRRAERPAALLEPGGTQPRF
jgi:hypothetical protein